MLDDFGDRCTTIIVCNVMVLMGLLYFIVFIKSEEEKKSLKIVIGMRSCLHVFIWKIKLK